MTDREVADYVAEATRHPPTQDRIDRARIADQQRLLQECWDFDALGARLRRLLGLLRDNQRVIDANGVDVIDALERQTQEAVVAVAGKFSGQLRPRTPQTGSTTGGTPRGGTAEDSPLNAHAPATTAPASLAPKA